MLLLGEREEREKREGGSAWDRRADGEGREKRNAAWTFPGWEITAQSEGGREERRAGVLQKRKI